MNYIFREPASLSTILILFIGLLFLIIYLNYIFVKRSRISQLKKRSPILLVGFPNSGKTFLMKELSKNTTHIYDKILNLNYTNLVYNGTVRIEILDHQGPFLKNKKLNQSLIKELKHIDPKGIIAVIDVSTFGEPIGEQIEFIKRISHYFDKKKIFLVANKVTKESKAKLKEITKVFGPNFYKIRNNKPEDVNKLRNDLIEFLITKKD